MDDLRFIMTVGNGIQDRPDQNGGIVLALTGGPATLMLTDGSRTDEIADKTKIKGEDAVPAEPGGCFFLRAVFAHLKF